jgi:hypothetical protein
MQLHIPCYLIKLIADRLTLIYFLCFTGFLSIMMLTLPFCVPVQVLLYDASRKLLDSRFLKKDEVIKSGESIAFDGHLIEIGEHEGNHEPLMDLNIQGNDGNIIQKSGLMHGQEVCRTDKKSVVKG